MHPLIVAVCCCCFVFIVLYLFVRIFHHIQASPFSLQSLRPPEDLVLDRKLRDKVYKQSFCCTKVPKHPDAIVVGSGIGGLSVAATLAKAGWSVLVLEQHGKVGGCCHTFIQKGFEFDVGIHYIGDLTYDSHFKSYIDLITDGQLVWMPMHENFDTLILGDSQEQRKWYPMHGSSKDSYRNQLVKLFPNECQAIDNFISLCHGFGKSWSFVLVKLLPYRLVKFLSKVGVLRVVLHCCGWTEKSTQAVLDELTSNKELQASLSYLFGNYGVAPEDSPFMLHAFLTSHLWNGASYPRGGATEIAFHLIPVIEDAGGRVLTHARVKEILINSAGNAYGVRVVAKNNCALTQDLFAPVIISDVGLINTFHKLLPKEIGFKSRYNDYVKRIGSGHGAMSLFVGLDGSTQELGLKATNYWAYTSTDFNKILHEFLEKDLKHAAADNIPLLFISFPSAKDPTYDLRYPGKSACIVITFAPYIWFANWRDRPLLNRGEEYDSLKNLIGRKMWEQVVKLFPQLETRVEFFEVSTPLTNCHYLDCANGEIYGLEHCVHRFSPDVCAGLRAETDVPGLYLTGQDITTCGFAGAAYGGLLCASTLLKRNLFLDVMRCRLEKRFFSKSCSS